MRNSKKKEGGRNLQERSGAPGRNFLIAFHKKPYGKGRGGGSRAPERDFLIDFNKKQ